MPSSPSSARPFAPPSPLQQAQHPYDINQRPASSASEAVAYTPFAPFAPCARISRILWKYIVSIGGIYENGWFGDGDLPIRVRKWASRESSSSGISPLLQEDVNHRHVGARDKGSRRRARRAR